MRKYRIAYLCGVFRVDVNVGSPEYPNWAYYSSYETEEAALSAVKTAACMAIQYKDGHKYFDDRGNQIS
jgi:hypothetical protein